MRSPLRAVLAACVVASAVSLMLGTTVFAASYKPDARLRLSAISFPPPSNCGPTQHFNNSWIGDNVYNTTGTNQKFADSVYSGGDCFIDWIIQISIQNDGATRDRFKVKVTGPDVSDGWKVTFKHGSTNVTSQVVNGTFQTGNLAHGATDTITMKAAYLGGEDLSKLVTITSVGGGAKDAVKVSIPEHI